jgi:hypothetical protein
MTTGPWSTFEVGELQHHLRAIWPGDKTLRQALAHVWKDIIQAASHPGFCASPTSPTPEAARMGLHLPGTTGPKFQRTLISEFTIR